MKKLTIPKIRTYIEEIESTFLTQSRVDFSFDRKWSSNFPDAGGVYTIFDKNILVYIGESANIKERMKEIKRTYNHSFRRKLGKRLFNNPPMEKRKFSPEIEIALNEYYLDNISISALEINFGRLEIESYLIHKYKDTGILNTIGKRNATQLI